MGVTKTNRRAFTVMEAVAVMVMLGIAGGLIWLGAGHTQNSSTEANAYQKMQQIAVAEQTYATTSGQYTDDASKLAAALGGITLTTDASMAPQDPSNTTGEEQYSVDVDGTTGQLTVAVHLNTGTDGATRCLVITVNSMLAATNPGQLSTPPAVDTGSATQCHAASL